MPEEPNSEYVGYLRDYLIKYPDTDARLKIARVLGRDGVDAIKDSHVSNYFLAAHWGEPNAVIEELAFNIYELSETITHYVNQPIIALSSGQASDILSDDEWLDGKVVFDFGMLGHWQLEHGFNGADHGRRMGVTAPYLGFGVLLNTTNRTEVTVDVIGEPKLERSDRSIPNYLGTVPLTEDRRAYHAHKALQPREMIFGHTACREVLHAVERKSGHRGLTDAIIGTA